MNFHPTSASVPDRLADSHPPGLWAAPVWGVLNLMKEYPLRITTEASSWVTEKFPSAIRIGRDCPPFAFGEDVAAVYPHMPDLAAEIVRRYNAYPELVKAIEDLSAKVRTIQTTPNL